jgi:hypothetical protein
MAQDSQTIGLYNYTSPVTNQDEKTIKKIVRQESRIKFLFGCIVFIIILVACVIATMLYEYTYGGDSGITDNTQIIPTIDVKRPRDYADTDYSLDYIKRNLPKDVTGEKRADIDLWLLLFKKSYEKSWDGKFDSLLGYTIKDLNELEIKAIVQEYNDAEAIKDIPADKETLFYGAGAVKINKYLIDSKSEFEKFVVAYGFNQKYVDEINNYVLKDDVANIVYPTVDGSINTAYEGDYGKRIIYIDPEDIYANFRDLKQTIFGKKLSDEDLVYASTRLYMYNQMGYVLMQSYINQNVDNDIKRLGEKNMYLMADSNFMAISKRQFWAWPYNKDISDARFAYGIMIKAFAYQYKLDEDKTVDLVEYVIKKDNLNMNSLNELAIILHREYRDILSSKWNNISEFYYENLFTSSTFTIDQKNSLRLILNKTNKFPQYIGRFNPMEESELIDFMD